MAISIIDVRKKRKVAMQKIRRAYRKIGITFKADNIKFETPKKGMSPEELQRLYNRYENIMQGNFLLNVGDGRYIDFATGEIYDTNETPFFEDVDDAEFTEDYTPVGSYVQHAVDLIRPLNYPSASNYFEKVVQDAIDTFTLSFVDKWFEQNSERIEKLYNELLYSVWLNDENTPYFVEDAIKKFETDMLNGVSGVVDEYR